MPIAGGEIELGLLCATAQGTLPASCKARCVRCARRDCRGAPPGRSHTPALALAAASLICKRVRTRPYITLSLTLTDTFRAVITGHGRTALGPTVG